MPFGFNSDDSYYLFDPYLPVPIYQGKDEKTNTTLQLDKEFLHIKNISIGNPNPTGLISLARFGHSTLIETPGGRMLNISPDAFYPKIIKNYHTAFDTSPIIFNNTLYHSQVKVPFINSAEVRIAEKYLKNYRNRAARISLVDYLIN